MVSETNAGEQQERRSSRLIRVVGATNPAENPVVAPKVVTKKRKAVAKEKVVKNAKKKTSCASKKQQMTKQVSPPPKLPSCAISSKKEPEDPYLKDLLKSAMETNAEHLKNLQAEATRVNTHRMLETE